MSTELVYYNNNFKNQVFPALVPLKYFKKYTSGSILFKILDFLNIYKSHFLLLINEDKTVLGSVVIRSRISLIRFKYKWYIYGGSVCNKYRGLGYGTNLLLRSLEWCKINNIKRIYLKVETDNNIAINLYKKFGFKVINEGAFKNQLIMLKDF